MWPVGVRRRRVERGGERELERRVVRGLVRSIVGGGWEMREWW